MKNDNVRHTFVYFLLFPDTDEIKIGMSSHESFGHRLRAIKTARGGQRYFLLKTVEGGRALERSLHRALKQWRIGGEWFRYEPIAFFINSLPPNGNGGPQLSLPMTQ